MTTQIKVGDKVVVKQAWVVRVGEVTEIVHEMGETLYTVYFLGNAEVYDARPDEVTLWAEQLYTNVAKACLEFFDLILVSIKFDFVGDSLQGDMVYDIDGLRRKHWLPKVAKSANESYMRVVIMHDLTNLMMAEV